MKRLSRTIYTPHWAQHRVTTLDHTLMYVIFLLSGSRRVSWQLHHGTSWPSHVHICPPWVSRFASSMTLIMPSTLWSTVMAACSYPKAPAPRLPMSVWTQLKMQLVLTHDTNRFQSDIPWINWKSSQPWLFDVHCSCEPMSHDFRGSVGSILHG